MTQAYRVTDAREAIAAFEPEAGVSSDQILEIVADLDGWDQEKDGLIELQTSTHDNKVRLSNIIQERTGLSYSQAPAFFQKMEEMFLDRRIPLASGVAESPQEENPQVGGGEEAGAAAAMGLVATGANVSPRLLNAGEDRELVARLTGLARAGESNSLKAGFFMEAGQSRGLFKYLTRLKENMDANESLLSRMSPAQAERVLSHPSLRRDRAVLAMSREYLGNMLGHYWSGGKVRESDLITLRRYTEAVGSLNRGLETLPRQLPTVIGPARAASSTVTAASVSLRQAGLGVQSMMGRLSASRATVWGAGIVVFGGLLALGLQGAADAASPELEKHIEIVTPPSSQPGKAPEKEKIWTTDELPKAEAPTISIEDLPSAPRPKVTARRK